MRTAGKNRREIVDVDGLWLARFRPLEKRRAWETEPAWVDEELDIDEAYLDD